MSDNITEQRRMAAQMKAEFTAQRLKAAHSSTTAAGGGTTDDHMFWDYGAASLPSHQARTPQVAPHNIVICAGIVVHLRKTIARFISSNTFWCIENFIKFWLFKYLILIRLWCHRVSAWGTIVIVKHYSGPWRQSALARHLSQVHAQ